MRWPIALLVGGLLAAGTPATARAQTQECELLPGAREATRTIYRGHELVHISGPANFACPNGVILRADSAVGSPGSGEIELIGHVFYQDSVKTLNAGWARYLREESRLLARDQVELADRKSRSVIKGAEMEYLPANERRPEAETIIQGRPHATFYQQDQGDAAAGDSVPPPLEVDADLMRIFGDNKFLALGQVELTRGETRGYAREGEFDQTGQLIILTGSARLEGEAYKLAGDRIEATLASEKLEEVIARRDAVLEGEDMDLRAPELRVFFEDGEVHRLIAIRGGETGEGGGRSARDGSTSSPRPVVLSRELQLTADSIDALLPGRQMEQVVAVGNAYAVRTADSLDVGLPEVIAHDWLVGDTITSYFAPAEKPAPDTRPADESNGKEGEQRVVLERLVAVGEGGRARALYRIREKGREAEPPGANYLVAERIVLIMAEGEVKDVEADGPIEGMHLQPAGAGAREPAPAVRNSEAAPAENRGSQPN